MKKLVLLLFFVVTSFITKADQLAYITKEQAQATADYLMEHPNIILFCGCCSLVEPVKVKVIEATIHHTGYEDYYEVEIEYEDEDGEYVYKRIDLAYVWQRKFFRYKTLGDIMNLDHDYCVKPKDYNNPKYIEKDI